MLNPSSEASGEEPEARQHGRRDKRQTPVHDEHHGEHAHENQDIRDERQKCGDQDVFEHADIADDAERQIALTGAMMERQRERLQVTVELAANFSEHAVAREREPDGREVRGERSQPDDCDERQGRQCKERGRADRPDDRQSRGSHRVGRNEAIEDEFQRPWLEQPQADFSQQSEKRPADNEPLSPHQRPEAPHECNQTRDAVISRAFLVFQHRTSSSASVERAWLRQAGSGIPACAKTRCVMPSHV
jgi:hypothetical protein